MLGGCNDKVYYVTEWLHTGGSQGLCFPGNKAELQDRMALRWNGPRGESSYLLGAAAQRPANSARLLSRCMFEMGRPNLTL